MFFFDKKVFFKYFVLILSILAIIFNVAMIFFGYELMQFDIPGSFSSFIFDFENFFIIFVFLSLFPI